MTLTTTVVGMVDGKQQVLHKSDGLVLITGPIVGKVTLSSGEDVDVTEHVIEVADEDQMAEIKHLIGIRHEEEGHPHHDAENPFVHHCTDECGKHGRKRTHRTQKETHERLAVANAGVPGEEDRKVHASALGLEAK